MSMTIDVDRSISELLALETYDGLTDGEVHTLIDWFVNDAEQRTLSGEKLAANASAMEQMIAANQQSCDTLSARVQSILERSTNIPLGVVTYE